MNRLSLQYVGVQDKGTLMSNAENNESSSSQSLSQITLPYEFGRYRLDKLLGEGAMGAVYLAEDKQLGRKVALKTPSFEGERQDLLERFHREARSAALLNHPNICTVYDVGEHEGTHYISMEYVAGKPLTDYIDPKKLQTEKQIGILIRKLALAMKEAHEKLVVHRDLKPDNIMINGKNEPLIMDFGLAVQTDVDVRATKSGVVLGSPAYMSPEQVRGEILKVGPASDIYSLGVVLYELMTGKLPFEGSMGSVMAAILNDEPKRPQELRPDLHSGLEKICSKMMSKTIEGRFTSMADVVKELNTFLKGGAAKQSAVSTTDNASKKSVITGKNDLKSLQKKLKQLCDEHHFPEAIRLLEKTIQQKKPKAAPLVAWAKKELPRIKAEPERIREEMAASVRVAKKMIKVRDYAQAAAILQQVPIHARTPEMESVLDHAIDLQSEVDTLIADIDLAIHREKYDNIKPAIKRLLEIQPNNKKALDLKKELATYGTGGRMNLKSKTEYRGQSSGSGWIWKTLLAVAVPVFLLTVGTMYLYMKMGTMEVALDIDQSIIDAGDVQVEIDGKVVNLKQGLQKINLSQGSHRLVIKQGNMTISSSNFQVIKGVNSPIRIALQPTQPEDPVVKNDPKIDNPPTTSNNIDTLWATTATYARTPLPDGPPGEVVQLKGHTASLYGIAIASDGRTVASISGGFGSNNDKTIRLWDISSSKELNRRRIDNISTSNTNLAFSPDGQQIFGAQNQLNMWDSSTLKRRYSLNNHKEILTNVACSEDGAKIATAARNGSVIIWKVTQEGRDKHFSESSRININTGTNNPTSSYVPIAIAFLPDNKRVLITSVHWEGTKLYDIDSGKVLRRYMRENSNKPIINQDYQLALSQDGKYFAAIEGKTIYLINIETGKTENKFIPNGEEIRCVSFLPNGKHLLATGDNTKVDIINCLTGKVDYQYEIGQHARHSCVTPDGRFVATACNMYYDDTLKKNVTDGDSIIRVIRLPKEFAAPNIGSEQKPAVIVKGTNPDSIKPPTTSKPYKAALTGFKSVVRSVRFTSNGSQIFAGGDDDSLYLGSVSTGKYQSVQKYAIRQMDMTPDSKLIAMVGLKKGVRIFNRDTGKIIDLKGFSKPVTALDFHPISKKLATYSQDGKVKIWDVSRKIPRARKTILLPNLKYPAGNIQFNSDGKRLIAVPHSDIAVLAGKIFVINVLTGTKILDLNYPGNKHGPGSLAVSPTSPHFVVGTYNGYAIVMNIDDGKVIGELRGHSKGVYSLA